jgi:hypothetical protein
MDEMNITSAQYVADLAGDNVIIVATIDGTEMSVPNNATGNRHYDEIQRQVAAGTLTIQDAD